jgi:xanthine dehydrogenase YagS FAD-binding subunit
MHPFTYERAADADAAVAAVASDPGAAWIAGGTELVNWLKEGISTPSRLVDITGLPGLDGIEAGADGLRLGALARLADIAGHDAVRRGWPAIAEALRLSASQQLRNMATIGGNLLQRTRCPYYRAEAELPCNRRRPGSGCAALAGEDRTMAIFGWSESCLATHPSDVAVVLAALDATVTVRGPAGERTLPLADLHRLPGDEPARETTLARDELITGIAVPASPAAARSRYLKVRERASYEFALVSAAAGLDLGPDGVIREARVALGGVAAKPWRLAAAERALPGTRVDDAAALRAAIEGAFAEARPRRRNGFKVELARRAAVRALRLAGGVEA